jgi:c-di-GMP-binding flagellar brake protein YcgR
MQWTEDKDLINFLNGIMQAFRTSRAETIILITVIALFLAIVISIFLIQNRKKLYRRLTYARSRFEEQLKGIELTEMEKNILDAMSKALPGGELRKHEVVTDENAFDRAAQLLITQNQISDEAAAALRLKLGFRQAADNEPIYTTAEIPKGEHLYIVDKYNNRCHGFLTDITPKALFIKIHNKTTELPRGKKLRAYFRHKSGIYTFVTQVMKINDDTLACTHTDRIHREQKRQYYRKEVDTSAVVEHADTYKEQRYTARVYDLGGGGTKMENPDRAFRKGETVTLFFSLDEEEKVTVPGNVIKTSDNESLMHVEFTDISEAVRDKFVGYIFNH